MPKAGGNKKGKQPAKRPASKSPNPRQSGNETELSVARHQAILEQLEALEWAHGMSAGGLPSGVSGKRGWVTRQVAQQSFHSQIVQRLMSVTAKMVGTPGSGPGEAPRPVAPVQQDLVPRELVPSPGGGPVNAGEFHTTPPHFIWAWGPGSQTAAPGSSGVTPLMQPVQAGGITSLQAPLGVPGSGGSSGPNAGRLPGDALNNESGGRREPRDDSAPGMGGCRCQKHHPLLMVAWLLYLHLSWFLLIRALYGLGPGSLRLMF